MLRTMQMRSFLRRLFILGVKIHGLKTISTVFPNGIIGWMWGPVSVRENDIGVINLANYDQYLVDIQPKVTELLG
jgi:hypothetical protein